MVTAVFLVRQLVAFLPECLPYFHQDLSEQVETPALLVFERVTLPEANTPYPEYLVSLRVLGQLQALLTYHKGWLPQGFYRLWP